MGHINSTTNLVNGYAWMASRNITVSGIVGGLYTVNYAIAGGTSATFSIRLYVETGLGSNVFNDSGLSADFFLLTGTSVSATQVNSSGAGGPVSILKGLRGLMIGTWTNVTAATTSATMTAGFLDASLTYS